MIIQKKNGLQPAQPAIYIGVIASGSGAIKLVPRYSKSKNRVRLFEYGHNSNLVAIISNRSRAYE